MRLFIFFFLIFIPFLFRAQTYKGKVIDTHKKELNRVSVIIYDDNNKTIAYTYTTANGEFTINDKEKLGKKIVFSYIGYAKKTLPLSTFSSRQIVELEEKPFSLQEVKVRPEKIQEQGDTLTYNVSSFIQGQDKSIADVIKKMPGLNVSENGQITFRGKPISNFYIEGLDLMGSKYSQASENIQASKIKNVQVISNHQDIKTLQNVVFSDQTALNITLKDDVKNVWFGVIEKGVGFQKDSHTDKILYDGKLLGMLFSKKMQNLSTYKYNNIGKELTNEINDLTSKPKESFILNGIIQKMIINTPDIDKENTYFNTSHLITTNQLFKTKKGSDLRFHINYLWNRDHTSVFSETYYTDILNKKITEKNSITTIQSKLNTEINYKINNNNLYFTNNLSGTIDLDQASGLTFLNKEKTIQYVNPKKIHISEEFNLIKNNSIGDKIGLSSTTAFSYQPEQLLTISGDTERLKIFSFYHQTDLSYRKKIKDFTINNQIVFSILQQKMHVNNISIDTLEKYQQYNINLMPSIHYEYNKLKFNLTTEINTALKHYENKYYTRISLRPVFFAQYTLNNFWEIKLNYNYSEKKNSLLTMYRSPIFTSYRTQNTYNGQLRDVGLHLFHLTFYYKQPIKRLFAGISTLWLHHLNEIVFQNQLIRNVYIKTPTNYHYNPNIFECNLFASHSLYWGKTTIATDVSFGKNDYTLLYKNTLEKSHIYSVRSNLKITSQPFKKLSFELNSSINIYKQFFSQKRDFPNTNTLYYKHHISTFLFPSKKWKICMKSSIYHSPITTLGNLFLLGTYVSYKTKRTEFQLSCKNLLNHTLYNQNNIEMNIHSSTSYNLRPREFMANIIIEL